MDVLHVAPHPDDELIGAPATLMALRDAGHRVVNFAASVGGAEVSARRRDELGEAMRRAGFELLVARDPFGHVSSAAASDRAAIERSLAGELSELMAERNFGLVVGPSPHERHPGHELVARAIRQVLGAGQGPPRWWLWRVWGELPLPTTVVAFGAERMSEIVHALGAHRGELERNDYRDLVVGRATATRVMAPELLFGFGSGGLSPPYAEMTTEVIWRCGRWMLGRARILDPAEPFPAASDLDVSWWVEGPSVTQRIDGACGDPWDDGPRAPSDSLAGAPEQ